MAVMALNHQGRVIAWNEAARSTLGFSDQEVLGRANPLSTGKATREFRKSFAEVLAGKPRSSLQLEWTARPAGPLRLTLTLSPLLDDVSELMGVMVALETDKALLATPPVQPPQEKMALATLDALPQHIAILDETGTILGVNRAWREFAEKHCPDPQQVCEGSNYLQACENPAAEDCPEATAFAEGIRAVMRGTLLEFSLEYPCHSPTRPSWYMGRVTRFNGDQPLRIVVAHDNVTELMQAEKAIQQLAYYDLLTGLPNRLLLHDRLGQALTQAKREGHKVGILFLDLDRFKLINDTLGHAAGDRLLKTVAERLNACVRKSDTVARIGGDEFVVILPSVAHTEDPTLIAQKILKTLGQAIELDKQEVFTSTSIGIAMYPGDGHTVENLIKNADMAMYQAKDRGRNNYQFFSTEMNALAKSRLTMETALRQALERNEFKVYYQEQTDLATGAITAMEALLRWDHPELGLLNTSDFLNLAEESGLIIPIGEWVLETACAQAMAWQQAGFAPMRVAVNLSSRQIIHYNLADTVKRILKRQGLDPQWLELELTENIIMAHTKAALEKLRELKELGVQVAIDDFGTGFSSLSYLKQVSLSRLKIDHSFIRDFIHFTGDSRVIKTIIAMAHNFNLKVIAEGVETDEQRDFLLQNGCDEIQGYLLSRPAPLDEVEKLLLQQKL